MIAKRCIILTFTEGGEARFGVWNEHDGDDLVECFLAEEANVRKFHKDETVAEWLDGIIKCFGKPEGEPLQ